MLDPTVGTGLVLSRGDRATGKPDDRAALGTGQPGSRAALRTGQPGSRATGQPGRGATVIAWLGSTVEHVLHNRTADCAV